MQLDTIICGDCLEVMKDMPDNYADTVITDPPYGLGFMGKGWDTFKPGSIDAEIKRSLSKATASSRGRNETSAAWASARYDHSRNAQFQAWCTVWAKECLRVAKPGAILMAFGGTRTYHRLTCAIEDAGWEIRDCIQWIYGSGFPKSLDISKAIDKAAGAEREIDGKYQHPDGSSERRAKGLPTKNTATPRKENGNWNYNITAPATEQAKLWDGWGTALKPSWEPIIVAMKPLDGTYAQNAEKHGVAGLWIDGSRIEISEDDPNHRPNPSLSNQGKNSMFGSGGHSGDTLNTAGRFPSNTILSCTCEDDHEPDCPVRMLDEQSGESGSNWRQEKGGTEAFWNNGSKQIGEGGHTDSGGASRFFQIIKENGKKDLILCHAKGIMKTWKPKLANTVDDNSILSRKYVASVLSHAVTEASQGVKQLSGLTGLSMNVTPRLLRHLCETVIIATLSIDEESLPASFHIVTGHWKNSLAKYVEIQKPIDTTMITTNPMISDGSAVVATLSTTKAFSEVGVRDSVTRFRYCAKSSRAERGCNGKVDNIHPTCKPLALMEYLCKLTKTPTGGIVLDPFGGSGSTGVAAYRTGRNYILIEKEEEYAEIARARIQHEKDKMGLFAE